MDVSVVDNSIKFTNATIQSELEIHAFELSDSISSLQAIDDSISFGYDDIKKKKNLKTILLIMLCKGLDKYGRQKGSRVP